MMTHDSAPSPLPKDDVAAIDELRQAYKRLTDELGKVIVGQQRVIEELAVCLFARGHALLMGVPGLAKTLLISKLAEAMSLSFSRIQFTPDLMPTLCWPTKSTVRHPKRRRPCWKPCRNTG